MDHQADKTRPDEMVALAEHSLMPCPVCGRVTDSLKQYRVIKTAFAIPLHHVELESVVRRACPPCMRAFVWERCRLNGLATLVVGFGVFVPYSLALTLA